MGSIETAAPLLTWSATSPTSYGRDLDDLERFYRAIAAVGQGRPDRHNWSVSAGCKLNTSGLDDDEQFVRHMAKAWKALRRELPSTAAVIDRDADGNERWVYRVADQQEMDKWIAEVFHVHKTACASRQLFPFEDLVRSDRAVLHVLPVTREVVVSAPHTHLDGIGMAILLRHLVSLFVLPEFSLDSLSLPPCGTEVTNLTPPIALAARVPPATDAQRAVYETSMRECFGQGSASTIKLLTQDTTLPARRTRMRWLTLDHANTARLRARCKALGLTVTTALQAALTRAAHVHGRRPHVRDQGIMALYDLRGFVEDEALRRDRLVSPMVFAMPARYTVGDDFADAARHAGHELRRFREDDVLRAAGPLWARDMVGLLTSGSAAPPPGEPTPADLNFSSMGLLDEHVPAVYSRGAGEGPDVEISDLWFALDMLHPNMLAFAWTWQGRLTLEVVYNEIFHREDSVTLLFELIHEQLSQGLGVDLKFDMRFPGEED